MKEGEKAMKHRFFKKAPSRSTYDPDQLVPVIRSSICTGEKAAGFREIATGRFREVMAIRSPEDLQAFRDQYGITGHIETIY